MSGAPQPAAPVRVLTTVDIQQMLEENAKLIAALVENQNIGKLDQCSAYQKRLQENLVTLASLADSQATPQQQAGAAAAVPSGGGQPR
ncbi:hypothetical protein D9Q98_001974 [Chlorella vulgaris]|uniref:SS18 N-terminal domain-containing protein n=1 Tax=Chlorella vulgaris TaxID=3077 RepID=A0A9D4Z0A7_CHLVU|nr:hypothetical protein D9Q98_001974 [Chlorella vulgaris]